MGNANWKAIGLGALDLFLLVILALGLAQSVGGQSWIYAQICLVGILILLSVGAWQIRRLLLGSSAQKPRAARTDLGVATIVKLVQFTACGLAAIIIYAIQYDHWRSASVAKIAGMGLLTAGGSLAAGALLGFIFGVPKSQSAPASNGGGTPGSDSADATSGDGHFGANTNLEQISDWLTKTIVGVSLVELSKMPPLLDKLAWYVAAGMGDAGPDAKAVALVIIVYFVSAGFLISYLWTRMELTRAFSESTLSQRVSDLEQQSQMDANAIATIDRWLNHHPPGGDEDKARRAMMDAIKSASPLVRARVFVTADDFKRSAPATKIREASDLTLPIFQALVEGDSDGIFHRNRAQYAFVLMTQTNPDWGKALSMVQEAIRIRDGSKDPGWPEYEFTRAICTIKTDPQARAKPDVKAAIDADLKKADDLHLDQGIRDRLDLEDVAGRWKAGQ
jgi:hypothetical protein